MSKNTEFVTIRECGAMMEKHYENTNASILSLSQRIAAVEVLVKIELIMLAVTLAGTVVSILR